MGARIEGYTEALKALDKAPEEVLKLTTSAFRKAAAATRRDMAGKLPPRWRRLLQAKTGKDKGNGHIRSAVGLFNVDGRQKTMDWFKAYWANYGTLQRRDPQHHFDTPIKKTARRRNNVGQPAQHFFEHAAVTSDATFTRVFEAEMDKTIESVI